MTCSSSVKSLVMILYFFCVETEAPGTEHDQLIPLDIDTERRGRSRSRKARQTVQRRTSTLKQECEETPAAFGSSITVGRVSVRGPLFRAALSRGVQTLNHIPASVCEGLRRCL